MSAGTEFLQRFAGVIIVADCRRRTLFGRRLRRRSGKFPFETLAAQLVTAPVLLVAFGQISADFASQILLTVPFILIHWFALWRRAALAGAMVAIRLMAVLGYP